MLQSHLNVMPDKVGSEYLQWVKTRKRARLNLAVSGVLPCPLAELGARIEDLEIDGPDPDGYGPLQQAIAGHCRVPAECVVTASGASMANFIVMAALFSVINAVVEECTPVLRQTPPRTREHAFDL